jgi:hypothetical protein
VSRLGTILRISGDPANADSETSSRSEEQSVKSGAGAPAAGRSPQVETGEPLNVMVAIRILFELTEGMTMENKMKNAMDEIGEG